MNGPIEAIEDHYEKLCPNGEILAQQDIQCHPNHSLEPFLRQKYPSIDKPFVNAGVLIGPARRFVQVFDSFPWKTFIDDQGFWNQVWADQKEPLIKLDHDKRVSTMMRMWPKYTWKTLEDGTRAALDPRGHQVPIIHLAGDDKHYIQSMLKKTNRRGVPRAYKYPIRELFIMLICLMCLFLILFIVFAVLFSQTRRSLVRCKDSEAK
jgi:hypothetical protein